MAIGDLVATLSFAPDANVSYAVDNPDFSVTGAKILQAVDLAPGFYSFNISMSGPKFAFMQFARMDYIFVPPPPPPPPLLATVFAAPSTLLEGQTAMVAFSWNDTVLDFTVGAVAVTNGSLGPLIQTDPSHFTAVFTPTPNFVGTATIQVLQSGTGGAVYFNAAGSVSEASNIVDIALNTTEPPPSLDFSRDVDSQYIL